MRIYVDNTLLLLGNDVGLYPKAKTDMSTTAAPVMKAWFTLMSLNK